MYGNCYFYHQQATTKQPKHQTTKRPKLENSRAFCAPKTEDLQTCDDERRDKAHFCVFAILLSVKRIPIRHEKSTETMPCVSSPFTSKKVQKSRDLLVFCTIKDNLSSSHPSPFTIPPVTLDFRKGHEWLRKVMFPVLQTVIFAIMINRALENSYLSEGRLGGYSVRRLDGTAYGLCGWTVVRLRGHCFSCDDNLNPNDNQQLSNRMTA